MHYCIALCLKVHVTVASVKKLLFLAQFVSWQLCLSAELLRKSEFPQKVEGNSLGQEI